MQHNEFRFSPERELALAFALPQDRPLLASFFAFDDTLARAVAVASEPIVGQLKLAWWRDAVTAQGSARPRGNPVLDELGSHLGERLPLLAALVDGWEAVLVADPINEIELDQYANGRELAWHAIAQVFGEDGRARAVAIAARVLALAELAAILDPGDGRDAVVVYAKTMSVQSFTLSRRLRPLAVLAALARRSLQRGGGALMDGRMSALVALRAGTFGR